MACFPYKHLPIHSGMLSDAVERQMMSCGTGCGHKNITPNTVAIGRRHFLKTIPRRIDTTAHTTFFFLCTRPLSPSLLMVVFMQRHCNDMTS
uniref:Uncharacterized protein n=1 Tax=Parascaris univalens TaxID=6257 RepID=A0A914ZQR8_PARUN